MYEAAPLERLAFAVAWMTSAPTVTRLAMLMSALSTLACEIVLLPERVVEESRMPALMASGAPMWSPTNSRSIMPPPEGNSPVFEIGPTCAWMAPPSTPT